MDLFWWLSTVNTKQCRHCLCNPLKFSVNFGHQYPVNFPPELSTRLVHKH